MSQLARRSFLSLGGGAIAASMTACGGGGGEVSFPPVASSGKGPAAVAKDGSKFQTDANAHTLVVTTASGTTKRVGGVGFAQGKLNYPTGVATLNGLAYVVETGNHRVQVFDATGASVGLIGVGELLYPGGIAAGTNEIFVSDSRNARVVAFSPSGQVTRVLGVGKLSAPRGLSAVADGVVVADPGLRQVVKLGFDGNITAIGADWVLPYDAATDGANVYVADAARNALGVVSTSDGSMASITISQAAANVSFRGGALYVS